MNVTPWRDQPLEQARLLNPGFLGALLFNLADGYQQASEMDNALPYALSYVGLPIVLHKATRDALPASVRTSMVAWISVNAFAQVGFAERTKALVPLVRDAIAVSYRGSLVDLSDARIRPLASQRQVTKFAANSRSGEVRDCLKKATFVGRWFAGSGDYTTVMALWGIRP